MSVCRARHDRLVLASSGCNWYRASPPTCWASSAAAMACAGGHGSCCVWSVDTCDAKQDRVYAYESHFRMILYI